MAFTVIDDTCRVWMAAEALCKGSIRITYELHIYINQGRYSLGVELCLVCLSLPERNVGLIGRIAHC